ncbi:Holo-[acyl-carrier-protein] synthase [subsurface metagenome]
MILGLGIDVVHVYRLRRWSKIPGLYQRFFNPDEIKACLPRGEAGILSLAARFAAKEAFGKALGTGLQGFSLREISVINNKNGKPIMYLSGRAEQAFKKFGGKKIFLSLSHEQYNALAVVIIEGN